MNRVIISITVPPLPCSLHLLPSPPLRELLMYSGVRLVAPPLMEFPIFSFLHRPRPSLLGFTRFLRRSRRLFARLIDSRTSSRVFASIFVTSLPVNSGLRVVQSFDAFFWGSKSAYVPDIILSPLLCCLTVRALCRYINIH